MYLPRKAASRVKGTTHLRPLLAILENMGISGPGREGAALTEAGIRVFARAFDIYIYIWLPGWKSLFL